MKLGCINAKYHTFLSLSCQMEHQVGGLGALVLSKVTPEVIAKCQ